MPEEEVVNTSKFTVDRVLYNRNKFSVGIGSWISNGQNVVAIRENKGYDRNGYFKPFGNSQWHIIPNKNAKSILNGLLTDPLVKPNEYVNIIEVLRTLE